jgi:cell division protein FtsB
MISISPQAFRTLAQMQRRLAAEVLAAETEVAALKAKNTQLEADLASQKARIEQLEAKQPPTP